MIHGPFEAGSVITNGVQVGGSVWEGRKEGVIEGWGEGVRVPMETVWSGVNALSGAARTTASLGAQAGRKLAMIKRVRVSLNRFLLSIYILCQDARIKPNAFLTCSSAQA
jgi:hypothetical protein